MNDEGMVAVTDRKVLIVEDETLVRILGAEALFDAGFEVLEADTADEAIKLLELETDVQVLFTDIRMPGSMDGLELARIVHERWPTIKLLLTSGDTWPSREAIPDDGRFLPKPYKLAALPDEILKLLSRG